MPSSPLKKFISASSPNKNSTPTKNPTTTTINDSNNDINNASLMMKMKSTPQSVGHSSSLWNKLFSNANNTNNNPSWASPSSIDNLQQIAVAAESDYVLAKETHQNTIQTLENLPELTKKQLLSLQETQSNHLNNPNTTVSDLTCSPRWIHHSRSRMNSDISLKNDINPVLLSNTAFADAVLKKELEEKEGIVAPPNSMVDDLGAHSLLVNKMNEKLALEKSIHYKLKHQQSSFSSSKLSLAHDALNNTNKHNEEEEDDTGLYGDGIEPLPLNELDDHVDGLLEPFDESTKIDNHGSLDGIQLEIIDDDAKFLENTELLHQELSWDADEDEQEEKEEKKFNTENNQLEQRKSNPQGHSLSASLHNSPNKKSSHSSILTPTLDAVNLNGLSTMNSSTIQTPRHQSQQQQQPDKMSLEQFDPMIPADWMISFESPSVKVKPTDRKSSSSSSATFEMSHAAQELGSPSLSATQIYSSKKKSPTNNSQYHLDGLMSKLLLTQEEQQQQNSPLCGSSPTLSADMTKTPRHHGTASSLSSKTESVSNCHHTNGNESLLIETLDVLATPSSIVKYSQRDMDNEKRELTKKFEKEFEFAQMELSELESKRQQALQENKRIQNTLDQWEKVMQQMIASKKKLEEEMKRQLLVMKTSMDKVTEEKERALKEGELMTRKYKQIRLDFEDVRENETKLKQENAGLVDQLNSWKLNYEKLKNHAEAKIDEANTEIKKVRDTFEKDISTLKAKLLRAELNASSLEKTVETKTKENMELTKICDELLAQIEKS